MDQNFTKGRRAELVQSSCLYLACRDMKISLLFIDFSSYLRVSVYELGSVYLQLCEMLYLVQNKNYEELVDPSIFIPRFTNSLLKGAHAKAKDVANTAKNIISSMKRDWIQTGRKPSGICGAAIYMAALSHGIMYSRADIAKVVHMCEATITKRLNEFANTEAGSLTLLVGRILLLISEQRKREWKKQLEKKTREELAANCPEDARNLVEASKAAVANSRKEKRRKRAEEAKNAPPSATATEAVCRTLERKIKIYSIF
uniref:Putative transcription factor n=1 Tax=Arabidopsis thaliana TaxID=3702 RepID=Q9ZU39_ARATH|nr:putative transcription factor [Arabidopsis thaliana]